MVLFLFTLTTSVMYLRATEQLFKNLSTYVCQLWRTLFIPKKNGRIILRVLSFSPITMAIIAYIRNLEFCVRE